MPVGSTRRVGPRVPEHRHQIKQQADHAPWVPEGTPPRALANGSDMGNPADVLRPADRVGWTCGARAAEETRLGAPGPDRWKNGRELRPSTRSVHDSNDRKARPPANCR